MPWDPAFWTETLNEIQSSLSTWLPAIFGALLLLVIGWLVGRISQAIVARLLHRIGLDRLAGVEHWGQTQIHEAIEETAADFDINLGKLGQPIRVAVTSGPVSPPIDVTLWLVGQERTIRRLDHALDLIEARAAASAGARACGA